MAERPGSPVFVKEGLSRFDPHDPYYFAVSLNWRRFALLFIAAELGINLLFAALYMLQPSGIANVGRSGFLGAFFFSLETLATVGYGEMYPTTTYAHIVASAEILTGVAFTAIVTGLLFLRFSRPKAKIHYARHAVISRFNGRPSLMLRIGNARTSVLQNAHFSLHVLLRSVTAEGINHAAVVDLPLARPHAPVFAILFTVMHELDEASALYEIFANGDFGRLEQLRFYFTVTARDPAIGQEVSDVHQFNGSDIRIGMRYAEAVRVADDGRVVADYGLLSALVHAEEAPGESDQTRSWSRI